jgi:hypothetical protein
MGKLIKNHWARLIVLTAGTCTFQRSYCSLNCTRNRCQLTKPPFCESLDQVIAAIHGYFWPKVFWDVFTTSLNPIVKPVPILQTINLLFGLLTVAWEWPLSYIAGTAVHRSIVARLVVYPLSVLAAVLLYQATNAALYLMIGIGIYFWAYADGEVVCKEPWKLPPKEKRWGGAA